MAITLHTLRRDHEGQKVAALYAKITVLAGEAHAVVGLPSDRPITVDVEPGAGATATVWHTLENDDAAIAAGTAPPGSTFLREWPSGGVTSGKTNVFYNSASAIVCYSTGGTTTFRVRM